MKKLLTLFCSLTVCLLASISLGEDTVLESEFQAAHKLEKLCASIELWGNDSCAEWEDGRLISINDDGDMIVVPVTDAILECECLNKKIIEQIMKLTHLRRLWITYKSAEDADFPVNELKQLEDFEIYPDFSFEIKNDSQKEENIFPQKWSESIGASRSIINLKIPSLRSSIQEIAKMKQLMSLTLFDHYEEADKFPLLMPLKDSLRELTVVCKTPPQEAANVLKHFTSLQVLTVCCFDKTQNLDAFLNDIKHLQLRYLSLCTGEIGEEGEKILREWESLQEVVLPWNFPDERFQALEKIKIPVMLATYDKNQKEDSGRKVQMCQKFFKKAHVRFYRIDKEGNYIHWNELEGGIWM